MKKNRDYRMKSKGDVEEKERTEEGGEGRKGRNRGIRRREIGREGERV